MHGYLLNSSSYSELCSELVLTLKKLQVTDFPKDDKHDVIKTSLELSQIMVKLNEIDAKINSLLIVKGAPATEEPKTEWEKESWDE